MYRLPTTVNLCLVVFCLYSPIVFVFLSSGRHRGRRVHQGRPARGPPPPPGDARTPQEGPGAQELQPSFRAPSRGKWCDLSRYKYKRSREGGGGTEGISLFGDIAGCSLACYSGFSPASFLRCTQVGPVEPQTRSRNRLFPAKMRARGGRNDHINA